MTRPVDDRVLKPEPDIFKVSLDRNWPLRRPEHLPCQQRWPLQS